MKKLLLLLTIFLSMITTAQEEPTLFGKKLKDYDVNPSNGLKRCVSTEYNSYLRSIHNDISSDEEFENWIAPKVSAIKQKLLNSSNRNINTVITIPVVVHVIHNGDAVGSNENISDARVISQITVLNQDFRKMLGTPGYNTDAVGADIEIEFCLATKKPDGSATNGINRINLATASWSTISSVETTLKPQTQWDPTQYFNIWVCQFSSSQSAELNGLLGYAQFPSNSGLQGLNTNGGSANTDGVIIDYRCFGSQSIAPNGSYYQDYNLGRTTTHEIGHCFGLRHIWGDATCGNDYCADTPVAHTANFTCDVITNCNGTGNEMVENYMDYTNDSCMNIFTLDQKARVLAVMQNSPRRSSLATSTACQSLGVEDFGLSNFALYPNPNSGSFTVQFDSVSSTNEVKIIVNDMRGRQIYVKNYQNTGLFNEEVQLNNVQSGIYLVTVEDGNRKEVKKIVVE